MSSATTHRAARSPASRQCEVRRCEHCAGHYPLRYGFNRRFCRRRCKFRTIADRLLDDVRHDHQHCASCYRRLKTVVAPGLTKRSAERGKSIPDCATGRQHYHDHAVMDQRATDRGDPIHEFSSVLVESRMTCSCPVNHHMTVRALDGDSTLSKDRAIAHADRLAAVLDDLDDRGVHTTDFDRETLVWFVAEGKSRPGAQGDDRRLLRDALALAVQEAG